jgi:serine/threonine protein kinase
MERSHRLDILNEALSDLGITEEPIGNYYSMEKVIGAGKYGVVKLGKSVNDSEYKVAIKVIKLEKLRSQYHSIVQEIYALKKIDHPNVVKIHEIFKDERKLYIVMEYVEGKELFDFVVQKMKLLESEASKIAMQLLKTIKYLNEVKICHRDLKPENIIINPETLHIKLIDFGLSAFYSEFTHLETKVGTPYYVAPEVLDKNYGKECDIWSIGVITYVLLTGCPPFQAKTLPELFKRIRSCNLKYIDQDFKNLSHESYRFVKSCLCVDPGKRITAQEGLEHRWIVRKEVRDVELNDRYVLVAKMSELD